MKTNLLSALAIAVFSINLYSQVPQGIKYQTVVRTSNGEVLANQSVSMNLAILQGSLNGITHVSSTSMTIGTKRFM